MATIEKAAELGDAELAAAIEADKRLGAELCAPSDFPDLTTVEDWQKAMYLIAKSKGWWTNQETGAPIDPMARLPETIALIHSEASEALEEFRGDRMEVWYSESKTGPKPEGFGVELADVVIRCMDTAESLGIDLHAMMRLKANYNRRRPYRHGNKRA